MKNAFCLLLALVVLVGASASCFADASVFKPASPPAAPSPSPGFPENGEVLIAPDYEGSCEIKVIADKETDYYVYLKYIGEPGSSSTGRELAEGAEAPYESDLAFYVKAGQWAKEKIPVGTYRFYYATGSDFLGVEDLFGERTICRSAEEVLEFYTDENHYAIQYTVEFYKLSAVDFMTDIPREDFPTGSTGST